MRITVDKAAKLLLNRDCFLILCHMSPDGDTIGSASALCRALRTLGKKVNMTCSDNIPKQYGYLVEDLAEMEFTPEYIVTTDVASTSLLGDRLNIYKDDIFLAIDHHPSNTMFAQHTLLCPEAAATAEIIHELIEELDVDVDKPIADAIYTGISTDTGCFRYANTTVQTHLVAAEMIGYGADNAYINRLMFETKSMNRIKLEQMALNTIEYYFENHCAVLSITRDMLHISGADETELDGVSSIPRQIEGVEVGVTLREKNDGVIKVSLRTAGHMDASALCKQFGGGGHKRAAGCLFECSIEEAKKQLVEAIGQAFSQQ